MAGHCECSSGEAARHIRTFQSGVGMEVSSSSRQEVLSKARVFFASINSRKQKGMVFEDSDQAAETLCRTIDLLQSLQSSLAGQTVPLDPSSSDWKVLKTLLELLIRLGISPHLSLGVGILRDKQKDDSNRMSIQLSRLSVSDPSLQRSATTPLTGMPLLFTCAETLSSFVWRTSSPYTDPSSSPATSMSSCVEELYTTDKQVADTATGDSGTPRFPTEHSPDVGSPITIMHSPTVRTDLYMETQFLQIPSTRLLVMKFFSWDLMAAYLQLSFGPCETNEDIRHQARVRLKHMVEHFPVEQMVVASFVLLNRDSPTPPLWIRAELGKQLSKLVMRAGGLVTVLEELVGRVMKGSVESYDKVAAHLAKVPKSVATTDEYMEALCPQVLPLLLLKHKRRDSVLGEISVAALNNVFHTSVSLTCKIFLTEPILATKYLVQPMMRPLLVLNSMQKSVGMVASLSMKPPKEEHMEVLVTENELLDSLVQLCVLLTAGCPGNLAARESILLETQAVAPLFLELYFQLVSGNDFSHKITSRSANNVSNTSNRRNGDLEEKDLKKGFLDKGLGFSGPSEQVYKDQSNLSKLKSSLADIVMAVVNQPVESALPCILPFLSEHMLDVVRWPQEKGEIWETLQLKGFQSRSRVMYLSRLLRMAENWSLVLALMKKLLHKILDSPWSQLKTGDAESHDAVELLRHMQDFEELNSDAGTKALESDTSGAASLVKALLENELVLSDDDMLELVLHMVHSVLKGIRASIVDDSEVSHGHGSILTELLSSLQRVYGNACIGEKFRQMAFTLADEVSALCKVS